MCRFGKKQQQRPITLLTWEGRETLKRKSGSVRWQSSISPSQKLTKLSTLKHKLADFSEEKLAVVNLTLVAQSAKLPEVKKRVIRPALHFHRKAERQVRISNLSILAGNQSKTAERPDSPLSIKGSLRSSSFTPTNWDSTTMSLTPKLERRVVFTHKVSAG